MWLKYRIDDDVEETTKTRESMQSIYLAAYRYSLELCENPEIAREVAARFLENVELDEDTVALTNTGKA